MAKAAAKRHARAARRGEQAAQAFLVELGRVRPGLDPFHHLDERGVVLKRAPLELKVAGGVGRRDGRSVVLINTALSAARQRFTAAHELGHIVMHGEVVAPSHVDTIVTRRDCLTAGGQSREDLEADAFAAGVLMPRLCLLWDVPDGVGSLYGVAEGVITKLARRYKVSRTMMVYRLWGLGLLGSP